MWLQPNMEWCTKHVENGIMHKACCSCQKDFARNCKYQFSKSIAEFFAAETSGSITIKDLRSNSIGQFYDITFWQKVHAKGREPCIDSWGELRDLHHQYISLLIVQVRGLANWQPKWIRLFNHLPEKYKTIAGLKTVKDFVEGLGVKKMYKCLNRPQSACEHVGWRQLLPTLVAHSSFQMPL